jgi:hypothetical protein
MLLPSLWVGSNPPQGEESTKHPFRNLPAEFSMHYLLIYRVADGYLQRREQYRGTHLALAQAAVQRGELILGGALSEPADQALLLFQGDTPEAARNFAESDPYVQNGLVHSWEVRPWLTVVGRDAQIPLPPGVSGPEQRG